MDKFDFIVVGAGSAGCVLAERLSADRRSRVLLVEAGGHDRRFWIKTPIGYGKTFFDRSVNWCFTTEPDPGLAGRTAYWPRGKVLGGSSSINAMVYCRGVPGDYDDWRESGNPGWAWEDVEPVFRSFERCVTSGGSAKGSGSLWIADREPEYHPIKRRFYAAARAIDLPVGCDWTGANPEGVGAYQITTRRGLRWSAADAFLRPALSRPNLDVRTGAHVHRVLFENQRAVGIEYHRGEEAERAYASAEVVLSAGAVNTPCLLQLSGIGPLALLRDQGIDILNRNENVGRGLQDHLGVSYFYKATEPTLNRTLGSWNGRLLAGLRFVISRSGPLSLSVNQIGGLVRTSPDLKRPDAQLYFSPLSYSTEVDGKKQMLRPDPFPGFIMAFNSCRPTSTGRVEIATAEPTSSPRIAPNYLSTDRDVNDVISGARLIGRLQETRVMRTLIAEKPALDPAKASDQEIVDDFRARGNTVFHPCGTCRMGPEDQEAVVDPRLRVHGVEGLRIADASIFPNITSANTNAPTIMVAHKAAQLIAEDYAAQSRRR